MSPLQQVAKLFYEQHPDGRFEQELGWYLQNGKLWVNDEYAILARTCDTRTRESYEGEPDQWSNGNHNAWFVAYAAGEIEGFARAIRSLRVRYPFIVWGRQKRSDGAWNIVKTSTFLRKIKQHGKNGKSA